LKKVDGLPFIYENFDTFIKTLSPGTKDSIHLPLQAITNVQLTKNEKKAILQKLQKEKITIRDLLMTEHHLVQHNYPRVLADDSWKETQPPDESATSHIYALDCEFCKAGTISVLTRISLVDFKGNVVFDELVKPAEEITDYVTRYSGITEEMLEGVETTIHDIQDLFLKHVSSEDILVGHSLESDLNVMRIMHSKVVDTAIIYEHNRGPPSKPSLRWLAQQYLKSDIQTGEDNGAGHSSIEDAKACLDLVKLKIQSGRLFGTNVGEVSIFLRMAHNPNYSGDFKSLWVGYPNPREPYLDLEYFKLTKVTGKNDDEVLENYLKEIPNKKFAVVNLRDVELNSRWGNAPEYYTGVLDYDQQRAFERTNDRLKQIYEALPEWSLLICYSQLGDPREMYRLQGVRREFQKMAKENVDISKISSEESWDADKLDELLKATALAREALTFIKLKPSKSDGISE
jgi:RNA exonuclease 1